jgi:transmembrane sensor
MTTAAQTNVFECASEWYYRLREPEVAPELIIEWQAWLSEDPAHFAAFSEVEELMHVTGKVDHIDWPDDAELLDDDYDGDMSIAKWQAEKAQQTQPKHTFWWRNWLMVPSLKTLMPAMAMSCFLLGIISLIWWQIPEHDQGNIAVSVHGTKAGQHNTINLDDGSKITLGAKSLLTVAYSDKQRKVVLEHGEAYFDVAKDRYRPFVVGSGNRTITAVGTEFNVIRQSERVVVTVTEGKVKVAKQPPAGKVVARRVSRSHPGYSDEAFLIAGQQISYSEQTASITETASTAVATAWRDGNLQYLTEKLQFVVEDINRYATNPIRLGDSQVGELAYSGTVFTDRIDNWLESLPMVFPVKVIHQSNGDTVIVTDLSRIKIQ